MIQDWKASALQFHGAGEDKSATLSCCGSSKPLKVARVLRQTRLVREHEKAPESAPKTPECAFWHQRGTFKHQWETVPHATNVKVYPKHVNNALNGLINKPARGNTLRIPAPVLLFSRESALPKPGGVDTMQQPLRLCFILVCINRECGSLPRNQQLASGLSMQHETPQRDHFGTESSI